MVAAAGLALVLAGCSYVDDRPAAWGYISPVLFQPSCATESCHSRAAATSGLDFSTPERGYASLTALTGLTVNPDEATASDPGCHTRGADVVCEVPRRVFVIAHNPNQSRLVDLLRARGAPRMPPDRPLPERDIERVERWIEDGARETVNGPEAPLALPDAGPAGPTDAGPGDGGPGDAGPTDGGPGDGGTD
jgi:hypothetical protein